MKTLDAVELSTGDDVALSVIWLHGLGADGHDFEPIVPELELTRAVRFVFPHAPERPVTINGGAIMRAWYDIGSLDFGAAEDENGIRDSAERVRRLIDAELERGLAPGQIVLAGFSQGGAIVLHTALRETRPLAGVIALSTYLPLRASFAAERSSANAATPIFMAHGDGDPVVDIVHAARSRELLAGHGYEVEWHTYPMGHAVCMDEIRDLGRWLGQRAAD